MVDKIRFTVGMPTYDDFDGVYFTVQSLWSYHAHRLHEVLIIDNNPGTRQSQRLKELAANAPKTRYIPYTDVKGTAPAKNQVFENATAEHVLCIDSHILLMPGALDHLAKYYTENPGSKNLIQGPLIADNHIEFWTHCTEVWGTDIRGGWDRASDEQCKLPYFPINNMGTGLLACRKDAWLGFNKQFKGFGGEEWYIQNKFIKAGYQTLCLMGLRWMHRFADQTAPRTYPIDMFDRARNYYIGLTEIGEDTEQIREHYVNKMKSITADDWKAIVAGEDKPCKTCGTPAIVSVEEWHAHNCTTPSDLNEHLATLASYHATNVVDCGDRPLLTLASYSVGGAQFITHVGTSKPAVPKQLEYNFVKGTSLTVEPIANDLLFLDTEPHNADHVYAELTRWHSKCERYIVLHDTISSGIGSPQGVLEGTRRFLRENRQWTVIRHDHNNHGLIVLSCKDKQALPSKLKQAWNLTKAMATHVAKGRKIALPEVVEERLAICDTCEKRTDDRCSDCGCFIDVKATLETSECPLLYWPR